MNSRCRVQPNYTQQVVTQYSTHWGVYYRYIPDAQLPYRFLRWCSSRGCCAVLCPPTSQALSAFASPTVTAARAAACSRSNTVPRLRHLDHHITGSVFYVPALRHDGVLDKDKLEDMHHFCRKIQSETAQACMIRVPASMSAPNAVVFWNLLFVSIAESQVHGELNSVGRAFAFKHT